MTIEPAQPRMTTTGGDPQVLDPAWSATSILKSLGSTSSSIVGGQGPQEFAPSDIPESLVPPRNPISPQGRCDGRNPQYRGDD